MSEINLCATFSVHLNFDCLTAATFYRSVRPCQIRCVSDPTT